MGKQESGPQFNRQFDIPTAEKRRVITEGRKRGWSEAKLRRNGFLTDWKKADPEQDDEALIRRGLLGNPTIKELLKADTPANKNALRGWIGYMVAMYKENKRRGIQSGYLPGATKHLIEILKSERTRLGVIGSRKTQRAPAKATAKERYALLRKKPSIEGVMRLAGCSENTARRYLKYIRLKWMTGASALPWKTAWERFEMDQALREIDTRTRQ